MCKDTGVIFLLLILTIHKASEVWMIPGTAKIGKCIPIHQVAEQFPDAVWNNLLNFLVLTDCNTMQYCSSKVSARLPDAPA